MLTEIRARAGGVVERPVARLLDRAGRSDSKQRAVERPPPASALRTTSSSRAAKSSGIVGVPSRRSVPGIFPVSCVCPAQSRMSSAIWNARPSATPYRPSDSSPPEPSRHAASISFAGLEQAALEVRVDRRVGIVRLQLLHRLAAREAERRVGERPHRLVVARLREDAERAGVEVVTRRLRGVRAVHRPRSRKAAAQARTVDEVVVDERRHVHHLDRHSGRDRRLAPRGRGSRAAAEGASRPRRAPRRRPPRRARAARRRRARAPPRPRPCTPRRPGVA